MKSFGKILTQGADYSAVWPLEPELANLFPEQRIIWRFSLYVLANTFIPPNNHDFASLRRCSFTRNHAK